MAVKAVSTSETVKKVVKHVGRQGGRPIRVLIQTGKAVSINEVSRHIGYVLEKAGFIVVMNRHMPTMYTFKPLYDAVIFVYPCAPAYTMFWFYMYYKAKIELNNRAVYYTMVDGSVKMVAIPHWVHNNCEFIANSYWTKERLERAGLKVIDVIHHGYLEAEIPYAQELAKFYRQRLRQAYPDKVIFGYVGDFNFRKGLDKLVEAVKILRSRRDDFVVLLVTRKEVTKLIRDVPNIELVGGHGREFGEFQHTEIMGFYMSIDYLVMPSLCESFGLPLLEANAVGTPAVANNLPVFREYADMDANIVYDYREVRLYDNYDGIWYELHDYDPKELADAMEEAIEIRKKYPSEYEDRKAKVREKVKDMKVENLYKKFIHYITK